MLLALIHFFRSFATQSLLLNNSREIYRTQGIPLLQLEFQKFSLMKCFISYKEFFNHDKRNYNKFIFQPDARSDYGRWKLSRLFCWLSWKQENGWGYLSWTSCTCTSGNKSCIYRYRNEARWLPSFLGYWWSHQAVPGYAGRRRFRCRSFGWWWI